MELISEDFWTDEYNFAQFCPNEVLPNCRNESSGAFQWRFTDMPNYKLNAIMTDFQYEIPLQQVIVQHVKRIDLLQTSVITNDSPAKITEEVTNQIRNTQTFEVSYSKSIAISSKFFAKYSAKAEVSGKIFGIGANASITTEFVMELGVDSTITNSDSKSISNEVLYTVKKTVEVPEYEKVQELSYKAKVTVTGVAPSFENDSRLDSHTIRVLLSKFGFNETLIAETGNALTFEVRGTLTGSFGLDSVFSVTSLGKTRNSSIYYNVLMSPSNLNSKTDGYVNSF